MASGDWCMRVRKAALVRRGDRPLVLTDCVLTNDLLNCSLIDEPRADACVHHYRPEEHWRQQKKGLLLHMDVIIPSTAAPSPSAEDLSTLSPRLPSEKRSPLRRLVGSSYFRTTTRRRREWRQGVREKTPKPGFGDGTCSNAKNLLRAPPMSVPGRRGQLTSLVSAHLPRRYRYRLTESH